MAVATGTSELGQVSTKTLQFQQYPKHKTLSQFQSSVK